MHVTYASVEQFICFSSNKLQIANVHFANFLYISKLKPIFWYQISQNGALRLWLQGNWLVFQSKSYNTDGKVRMCLYINLRHDTWHPPLQVQGRYCFLSGSWPGGRSQNDDLGIFQTHAGIALSEKKQTKRTQTEMKHLLTGTEMPLTTHWLGG